MRFWLRNSMTIAALACSSPTSAMAAEFLDVFHDVCIDNGSDFGSVVAAMDLLPGWRMEPSSNQPLLTELRSWVVREPPPPDQTYNAQGMAFGVTAAVPHEGAGTPRSDCAVHGVVGWNYLAKSLPAMGFAHETDDRWVHRADNSFELRVIKAQDSAVVSLHLLRY